MWVRGLKLYIIVVSKWVFPVAPYVGAWIETSPNGGKLFEQVKSHPMWVRGLKHCHNPHSCQKHWSHPMWVRGLKLFSIFVPRKKCVSHPMWVRGLKHKLNAETLKVFKSHPMWVRGLKREIATKTLPLH